MSESRLERIEDMVSDIKVTLARQEEHLKEHMRRSLANEKAVELLSEEQKPMKELMVKIKFIHNAVLWVGGLIAFIHTVIRILEFKK